MSNVADRRIAELQNRVERLEAFITDAMPAWVAVAERVDGLPRPRFTAPKGWLGAKDAAHASGMSLPSFYRKWRRLGVVGVRFDHHFMFDPATLPDMRK